MKKTDFQIKKTNRDWVIISNFGHSHFRTKQGCEMLLDFIVKGQRPDKEYFKEAAERILSRKQFLDLRSKRKKNYINGGYLK